MTTLKHSFIQVSKSRFSKTKLKLENNISYFLGEDAKADLKLKDVKASVFMDGNRWVLMDVGNQGLFVNDMPMSSVELRENLIIRLGKYHIQYSNGSKIKAQSESARPLRIILLVLLLLGILLFLFAVNKNDTTAQEKTELNNVSELEPDVSNDHVDKNPETIIDSTIIDKMNSKADEAYNLAINSYDSGDLKAAMIQILEAASIDPENELIQNKVIDWQQKLDAEISRYYSQACFDLDYFRYYEAKSLFRIIVELAVDQTDIRFNVSQRLLDLLDNGDTENISCGG